MIHKAARAELRQDIQRLATGRMSNDEFDDRHYDVYESSQDRAVSSIATYCYGLYSSDLLLPIRLRGRYALASKSKATIARCILFLRSDYKYEWPDVPDSRLGRYIAGLASGLGLPVGIALTIAGCLAALPSPDNVAYCLLALGVPLTATCVWLGFYKAIPSPDAWQRITDAGDYDCWPFLRRATFEIARRGRQP